MYLFLEIGNTPITKMERVIGPDVWLPAESFNKYLKEHNDAYLYGVSAAHDRAYSTKNFEGFIKAKLKEYMASKAILKD